MLHMIHVSIITRPFKLIKDLQYINGSLPMEGAGKESFLPSSYVSKPLCIIEVNYNKHSQPSKSLSLVILSFKSFIIALHLAKTSFLHGNPSCYVTIVDLFTPITNNMVNFSPFYINIYLFFRHTLINKFSICLNKFLSRHLF